MEARQGPRADVAVVGAGITGLAAALRLSRAGARVTVLEAAPAVGGALRTVRDADWLFELGPNTVLAKPPLRELLRDTGLAPEVVEASPSGKRRYVWKGERLQALPASPPGLLRSPIFSSAAKAALLREPFVPRGPAAAPVGGGDESIAAFVRRRLGQPWLDWAVGPFVSGVYAGDPERLSVRWAVPRIAALEREHGSLLRGALARRAGAAPRGAMIGYRGGFERLAQSLAAGLPDVRVGTAAAAIRRVEDGYRIATPGEEIAAAQVVLALPADRTATLLAAATEGRSRELAAVAYAPVVVGCLGYRREQVGHPLDGFGFLAPRRESLRVLGVLFSSSVFPDRAPAGHVALTTFAGGTLDPALLDEPDDAVWRVIEGDLGRALGVRGEPTFRYLHRWPRAIPQYELGHGRFVELAAALERELPGVYLAGNWIGGASVPDCVERGASVAARALAALGERVAPAAR